MKELAFIREYFKPLQPSVSANQGNIIYEEVEPASILKPYIHCYWQLKTSKPLDTPYHYRVVSDGCIDIFFNLNDINERFAMGFCRKYTEFSIGNEFNYAGIRFYPSVFPQLFGVSAKILSDKDHRLVTILPKVDEFIAEKINGDFLSVTQKINDFFISLIQKKEIKIDERFYNALYLILKRNGHLETERELNTGLSSRQLRRVFNYYIGTTPKTFSQVVRFQYILNAKPSSQSLKKNKIYYMIFKNTFKPA